MSAADQTKTPTEKPTAGRKGDVLTLDMGEPIRLMDLVTAVTRLAGLEPDRDIPIAFTGPRPGEKRREELVGGGEWAQPTAAEPA